VDDLQRFPTVVNEVEPFCGPNHVDGDFPKDLLGHKG
jgi:hypothetical protein